MKKKGFTLIELLIVIIIIGILAVIVVGLVATNARDRAADAAAKADLREIQTALELYNVENGEYPADLTTIAVSGDVTIADYSAGYTSTTDCYTLTYTLANENDSGPNITNGVYTLVCKQ
jgi:type II secretion system protein G